uniref:Uncharacterized protein n=1 Tax=Arundo donax TaxID=35708 RepID=A0A0A9G1T7_ARUDO
MSASRWPSPAAPRSFRKLQLCSLPHPSTSSSPLTS